MMQALAVGDWDIRSIATRAWQQGFPDLRNEAATPGRYSAATCHATRRAGMMRRGLQRGVAGNMRNVTITPQSAESRPYCSQGHSRPVQKDQLPLRKTSVNICLLTAK